MKVAVMQPYLFPYIGYFQLIESVDRFVIYDNVNYIKGGWINRNYIQRNGGRYLFTISLDKASPNKKINQIRIKDNFKSFSELIRHFYSKAPCFELVFPLLESIISYEDRNLARFAGNSITSISSYLGLETEVLRLSDIENTSLLRGKERLFNICKLLNADVYINSIGGQTLYNKDEFEENGIELRFIKSDQIVYKQFQNEFIPDLSIIDVMMFNSVNQSRYLLKKYIFQ